MFVQGCCEEELREGSLISQSNNGVDAHGAPRGNVTRISSSTAPKEKLLLGA